MQVSLYQLISLIDSDHLVYRFASRAVAAAIGHDKASSADAVITQADISAAIEAVESPSMSEHEDGAKLFGGDPADTYMRDAHAASQAVAVLRSAYQFAV